MVYFLVNKTDSEDPEKFGTPEEALAAIDELIEAGTEPDDIILIRGVRLTWGIKAVLGEVDDVG